MRLLLVLVLCLGAVWGGYWFVGAGAIERGAADWFATSADQGIEAQHEGLSVQGFPNRFDLTVTQPSLSDPLAGIGWRAPFAQVMAMTWKPWHVIAVLPPEQELDLQGERVVLTNAKMLASLRLSPNSDLTFAEAVVEAHDLTLATDRGGQMSLADLVLALGRSPSEARDYRLGLQVTDLRPDPDLAARLPELGPVIARLHLDAILQMTAPIDRSMAETQPQLAGVDLRDFSVTWGALQLTGKGSLAPDAQGLAAGRIDLAITGWRQMPELAAALGLIRPEMAKSLNDGLAYLAATDGNPETLALPLTLSEGRMTLGPLPLGPAPAMAQRQ